MAQTLRLVQLLNPQKQRRVAVVTEPRLRIVRQHPSIYALASGAIEANRRIADFIDLDDDTIDYESVYAGRSDWKLLSPFDHPAESSRCFITGTGLTHKASVETRQAMHGAAAVETDSMKMYRIGIEGGRPAPGCVGAPPEWFYKGVGTILRAHGEALDVPAHGEDGGDEAEIAGCYVIAADGTPHRVGFVQGNEFSDHVMESRNYLYLAQSKLRACSIGPEIMIGGDLSGEIRGSASVERDGKTLWSAPLLSGEEHMCHSLANLEHHHFKHDEHRRPGDAHVHFFGADRFSFKDQFCLQDGDVMSIAFDGFGRPLRNPIRFAPSPQPLVTVRSL